MGRLRYSLLLCSVMLFLACTKDKDPLPSESEAPEVYQVDVHVAGYAYDGTTSRAKYWKNGTAITLSDGTQHVYAESIFVTRTLVNN